MTERAAAVRLWRQLYAHYHQARIRIPDTAARSWRRWVAATTAGAFLWMGLLVMVARALEGQGLLGWESRFLQWLGTDGPFTFSTAVWFQTFGTDITLILLVTLTAGIAVWSHRPLTALSLMLAIVIVDVVVRFGWLIWARSRPDLLYDGVASPGFHSFPSGHTGKTIAVYGFLIVLWIRASGSMAERLLAGLLLLAIACVVPLGRMSMGVHWPTDIIAGALVGLYTLTALTLGLRWERAAAATALRPGAPGLERAATGAGPSA